jgi:hypothetical protein
LGKILLRGLNSFSGNDDDYEDDDDEENENKKHGENFH